MYSQLILLCLRLFALLVCFSGFPCIFAISNYEKEVEKAEKLSFKIPQLSEEETRSDHMPEHLRCDACLAVATQISNSMENQNKKKRNSRLSESEVIELLENVCHKNFDQYGLKQVNGENRLSGPGLETEHVRGMTQMGGRWPHRLACNVVTACFGVAVQSWLKELCHYYVGDAGEMEIYETFLTGPDALKTFFCHRKGIYGHCFRKISSKMEF